MKIVYTITRSDAIAGAQLHVRDLAAAMRDRGHQVHVLVGGSEGPFLPLLDAADLDYTTIAELVRPVRPLTDLRCIGRLKREIRRHKPDLVHCHSSKSGILGRYAAHRLGVPSIFSAHGWAFAEGIDKLPAALFLTAERVAARWCDRILCGCESDRQMALHRGVGDPSKVRTIWYGLHPTEDGALADPSVSPPRMVMVARFEAQKDHETLIRSLASVDDLDWTLDLLGDGPLRPQSEGLVKELGLSEKISFLGAQPTQEILLRSQLFLLISNWEGLPLSTLEAMRVGLPLIGSAVGGISEQIVPGESGYIVPRGDIDQLSNRLRSLLSDPDLRVRFGRKGKERFDADFSYERMLTQVEAVYQEVVAKSLSRLRPSGRSRN